MDRWIKHVLVCLPALLTLGGCQLSGASIDSPSPRDGYDTYTLFDKTARSESGCTFDYRLYQPHTSRTSTTVMIAHGFLRDQDNMAGLSRALANHGVPVITLDLCNMRLWNGHHQRNSWDMRHLARSLGLTGNIIYAGFSAGALAAILAADEHTRAIIALDLVDEADLGRNAIRQLQTPLVGLSGAPSACNANFNARNIFIAREDASLSSNDLIQNASHCEFESPSDWLCEFACGDQNDQAHDDKIVRQLVIDTTINLLTPFLAPPVARKEAELDSP